MVKGIVYTV